MDATPFPRRGSPFRGSHFAAPLSAPATRCHDLAASFRVPRPGARRRPSHADAPATPVKKVKLAGSKPGRRAPPNARSHHALRRLLAVPETDRQRMRTVVSTFVLHLRPARVPEAAIRYTHTFGLGECRWSCSCSSPSPDRFSCSATRRCRARRTRPSRDCRERFSSAPLCDPCITGAPICWSSSWLPHAARLLHGGSSTGAHSLESSVSFSSPRSRVELHRIPAALGPAGLLG